MIPSGFLAGALDEEDRYRLKMGRFRDSDEHEMRALVERGWGTPAWMRLLGFGVHPGRIGYVSSRPRMEGSGVTFTFSHRWVTKRYRRPVPSGRQYFGIKSSAASSSESGLRPGDAAQSRSERAQAAKAAGAKWDRQVVAEGRRGAWWVPASSALPAASYSVQPQPAWTGLQGGASWRFQRYMERDGAAVYGIGTLGETPEERLGSWRWLEELERAGGRVQARLIMELPHELDEAGRRTALDEFSAHLTGLKLPHWAVIHQPEPHHDARNWHVHVAYTDRPIERWRDGVDGREPVFAAAKAEVARRMDFVGRLRVRWAEVVNRQLERVRANRRFDPRSYADAGVSKPPSVHVGSAAMALERAGKATRRGGLAVGRELEFRLQSAARHLVREAEAEERLVATARAEVSGAGALGSAGRAQASAVAAAAAQLVDAGLALRQAEGAKTVAGWLVSDGPRRLELAARNGPVTLRPLAAEVAVGIRQLARERLDERSRDAREVRRRYGEAVARLAGARGRLQAEVLVDELARARSGVRAAEDAFRLDGRRRPEEWTVDGLQLEAERRRLAVERDQARTLAEQALRKAFGSADAASVEALVQAAQDPARRKRLAEEIEADGAQRRDPLASVAAASIRKLGDVERAIEANAGEAKRRGRMENDPAALAKVAMPAAEATRLDQALASARERALVAERAVAGNPIAAGLARRRGLVASTSQDRDRTL